MEGAVGVFADRLLFWSLALFDVEYLMVLPETSTCISLLT